MLELLKTVETIEPQQIYDFKKQLARRLRVKADLHKN